jgi:hypothetical protein
MQSCSWRPWSSETWHRVSEDRRLNTESLVFKATHLHAATDRPPEVNSETRNIHTHTDGVGKILLANYVLHYQHRPTDGAVFTQLNTVTHRKVKIHTITRHERSQGEHRYKASISLPSVLDGGRVVNATHRPLCPWETASVLIVEEAGWAPGPVWAVTVTPTGPQTPGPSSPQRLRYLCT